MLEFKCEENEKRELFCLIIIIKKQNTNRKRKDLMLEASKYLFLIYVSCLVDL